MSDPNFPSSDRDFTEDSSTPLDVSGAKLSDSRIAAMLGLPSSGTAYRISVDWQPPAVEELRKSLPQYDVQQFLARGGMGAVYRGYQKTLDRIIAIKVLPPIFGSDGQYAERFKQEAKAMAKLSHPGIVGVFDAGETAEGILYIVMEFVDGTDVARLLASEGHIEPEQALTIVSAICDALAFAHENGILHRDIKPSNVLLDRRGRVKIVDFGLARGLAQNPVTLTGSEVAVGTADFIAPEVLIPGTRADARADLYAVGVMLYQMLTGQIPRGRFEMPSSCLHGLDKGVDDLIDRALQANPEKRHSSALEMRRELDRIRQKSVPALSVEQNVPGAKTSAIKTWAIRGASGIVALSIAALFIQKRKTMEPERPNRGGPGPSPALSPGESLSNLSSRFAPATWIPINVGMLGAQVKNIVITADGAWKLTRPLTLPELLARDVAVRVRVRRPADVEHTGIQVRMRGPMHRSIDFGRDDTTFQAVFTGDGKGVTKLVPHTPDIGVEKPVLLELAAVGDLTCAAIDGVVLAPLRTPEPSSRGGVMLWSQNAEFRELEVMILDGVAEDRWPSFVRRSIELDRQNRPLK